MRYHYEKPALSVPMFGENYICDHPVYNSCTLYKIGDKGLAVIQQRFDTVNKISWWGSIDPWIANDLYLNSSFKEYFDKFAGDCTEGLYPTVSVRQIMWALKMKPIKREVWETAFDHVPI